MPIEVSHESLLQITVGCAVVVALLRLAAALLETALKTKLYLRLACFVVSFALELGRASPEKATTDHTSKTDHADR